jgi:hypothetical protein
MSEIDRSNGRVCSGERLKQNIPAKRLAFAFLFLAEIRRPLKLSSVSAEFKRALLTFAGAEPEDCAVVLHVHHAGAGWEIVAAERAFSWFGHFAFSPVVCLAIYLVIFLASRSVSLSINTS